MTRATAIASAVAVACWVAIVFGPPWAKLAAFTIGVPAGIGATPRVAR